MKDAESGIFRANLTHALDLQVTMIKPNENQEALKEWALDELKQISARNFELAKFLFGISAGSFAIWPFFDVSISFQDVRQILALIAIGSSAVVAILMANPAKFVINHEVNLSIEHEKYASRLKWLKRIWLLVWLVGVILTFWVFGGGNNG